MAQAQTALILNANARRVSARRARQLQDLCGAEHVYLSHTLEEAEQVARKIVERGYARVLSGGGDGTLVCVLNSIFQALEQNEGVRAPEVGVLRLGTGNAVASVVGARSPEADLVRLMTEPRLPTVPLGLIHSVEDNLDFPFAGIGYDGEVLNDYLWVRKNMKGPVVEDMMHSVVGYFTALFGRTLPRKLSEGAPPRIRITSQGRAIFRDPAARDARRDIPAGSVLYDGPAAMVAVGTVPFYGYNFRIFPFALDEPGMMQLRVVAMNPWNVLRNLPAIWRGEYRDPDILDFHVEDILVEGERELPYQIAGDARGYRSTLHFRMSERTVSLVSPRLELPAH